MNYRVLRFLLSSLLLLCCLTAARATDITISEMTITGFYPTSATSLVTGTVNTAGTTVTAVSGVSFQPYRSPANPGWPQYIRIKIGSSYYKVASVESATSLTLTESAGTQSGAAITIYPFVELRLYALSSFTPPELTTIIQQGAPGSTAWYQRYGVSIINNVAYVPAVQLVATTDAPNNQEAMSARWYAGFYAGNTFIQDFNPGFRLSSTPTSTTWPAIRTFNTPNTNVQRLNYDAYNQTQTTALVQALSGTTSASYRLGQQISSLAPGIYYSLFAGTGLTPPTFRFNTDTTRWEWSNDGTNFYSTVGINLGAGTQYTLPVFGSGTFLNNSIFSQNSGGTTGTIGGDATISGNTRVVGTFDLPGGLKSYTNSGAPANSAGSLYRQTDGIKGPWYRNDLATKWIPLFGELEADEYSSLSAAISAIGSTYRGLRISSTQTVSADLTIPKNVRLHFVGEGKVAVNAGVTVLHNGDVDASPYSQIIQLANRTASFRFNSSIVAEIPIAWYGAKCDGVNDDTDATQAAINNATDGSTALRSLAVTIPAGVCKITSSLVYVGGSGNAITIKGYSGNGRGGFSGSNISWYGANGGVMLVMVAANGSLVKDISVYGRDAANSIIVNTATNHVHSATLSAPGVTASTSAQNVTLSNITNIAVGTYLNVDTGLNVEVVKVTALPGGNQITALFTKNHAAGVVVGGSQGSSNVMFENIHAGGARSGANTVVFYSGNATSFETMQVDTVTYKNCYAVGAGNLGETVYGFRVQGGGNVKNYRWEGGSVSNTQFGYDVSQCAGTSLLTLVGSGEISDTIFKVGGGRTTLFKCETESAQGKAVKGAVGNGTVSVEIIGCSFENRTDSDDIAVDWAGQLSIRDTGFQNIGKTTVPKIKIGGQPYGTTVSIGATFVSENNYYANASSLGDVLVDGSGNPLGDPKTAGTYQYTRGFAISSRGDTGSINDGMHEGEINYRFQTIEGGNLIARFDTLIHAAAVAPANLGTLRFGKEATGYLRNNANDGDELLFSMNNLNIITFGGTGVKLGGATTANGVHVNDSNGVVTATTSPALGTPTATSIALGGGTAITKIVAYTPSLTPSSVSANTSAEQDFTVSGLTTADKVIVNGPAPTAGTGIVNVRVKAANTLSITFGNFTAGGLTPASGTYSIIAVRN